jgi:hypothetical protein
MKYARFVKATNDHHDGIDTSWCESQRAGEVHRYWFPTASGNRKRLKKAIWTPVNRFHSLARVACANVLVNVGGFTGPIEKTRNTIVGLLEAQMTGLTSIVMLLKYKKLQPTVVWHTEEGRIAYGLI